jgi:hypothetical protein
MKLLLRATVCLLGAITLILPLVRAADAAATTGTIEGRVLPASTGEYVERARVMLEGADRETFTGETGFYSLAGMPVGSARLHVFFTGRKSESATVAVAPGRTARRDFELAGDGPVKLARFAGAATRKMDGVAIAINEKRFAADIRDVIAADEFGPMADGNVGELLKHVPGVALTWAVRR